MKLVTLLPFIVLIGAMFLMTRSAKNKQRQMVQMRDRMQPGTGIRTIGGMYATVKEVRDDTVLLEVAPGIDAVFAKNAVGAVLDDEEYHRIVHGGPAGDLKVEGSIVPDDASSLTAGTGSAVTASDEPRVDLGKTDADDSKPQDVDEPKDAKDADAKDAQDAKKDDDTDAK